MPRSNAHPNSEIITFRVPSEMKSAIGEIANEEDKPVGELLRELIRERIKRKERREFEAEARRQSLLIAEVAKDPNSDEAQVLRELDALFNESVREWK